MFNEDVHIGELNPITCNPINNGKFKWEKYTVEFSKNGAKATITDGDDNTVTVPLSLVRDMLIAFDRHIMHSDAAHQFIYTVNSHPTQRAMPDPLWN